MRIAFYAPLKPPASGNRQGAGLLMEALARAGHTVELASAFRSYDGDGDADRQVALRDEGAAHALRLTTQWLGGPRREQPELWFTDHVYYKAPDWLGPRVSAELGIPYVIADPSHAPKRAVGSWATGHDAAAEAIRRADLLLCSTRHDEMCLEPLVFNRERIVRLEPFLDPAPFQAAGDKRAQHRAALAAAHDLDADMPWIVARGAMFSGDKLASYRALASALAHLHDLPWRLVVVGDGLAHKEVRQAIEEAAPGRACFLGQLSAAGVAGVCAACDVCVWPAVGEPYGTDLLEAQAAGIPVITCALRGVPEVVALSRAGLRAPPNDAEELAQFIRALLIDPARREAMGRAAMAFVRDERSIDSAAVRLGRALANVTGKTAGA